MRVYWPWWMLPFVAIVWLVFAIVRVGLWLVTAPFRHPARRRDVVRVKVVVQEKTPAHPKEGQAGEPA